MQRLTQLLILLAATTFAVAAFAHEPELARPHDFDREINRQDKSSYQFELTADETTELSSEGVKKITIDETRLVSVADVSDGRIVLKAHQVGKAVVRLHLKNGDVTTLIIHVLEPSSDRR